MRELYRVGRAAGLDVGERRIGVAVSDASGTLARPVGVLRTSGLEGDAIAIPLPSGAFDLVLCQQGLQFFSNRAAAAREMRRVVADGGRVIVSGMGKSGRIVRQTEGEADQLAGRIMLAAGYNPGRGAMILPKLGGGPRIGLFATHDSDGERIKAMQALGVPTPR